MGHGNVNKLAICMALGSVAVVGLFIYYRRKKRNMVPTEWKPVGEITELFCFPVKSLGVIRLNEINCSLLGLENELLRDRIFMVIGRTGNFVTARQYPKLVRIFPKINGRTLTLTAAGMLDIGINIDEVLKKDTFKSSVWNQDVMVKDCGDEISKWISRFILKEDDGLRLVYYPESNPTRLVPKNDIRYKNLTKDHVGALHDASSYMMINEGSITELNSRIDTPVTPMFFRPNFVVKGPPAFAEDDFNWVKIGDDTIFKVVMQCTRCVFTTIDPETGTKNSGGEPLKTLKSYRKFPGLGESPVMGIHLGVIRQGIVKVGDPVYIG